MSQTDATAFLDRLDQDATMRDEWQGALKQAAQTAVVALGSRHGHQFTAEEFFEALGSRERTMRDEDLAKVSGGLNPQPEPPLPRVPPVPPSPLLDFRRLIQIGLPRF
jgi:predicted ribosomally synthesized peptide with nif11-like leader